MKIITEQNAEHYTWGNKCDGWHLLKSGTLNVIKERMPAGTSEQLHYHVHAQQVFYILSGTAIFEIDGKIIEAVADQSLHIPKGTKHCIKNESENELVFLLISEPRAQNDRINI